MDATRQCVTHPDQSRKGFHFIQRNVLAVLTARKSGKTPMESEGSNCESSKKDSTRGEDFENHEEVKVRVRKAENTEKIETTKEISCQTDFDDILHQHLEQFEDEVECARAYI